MSGTPEGLRRHLGLVDAASLFVGVILGSGIFVAPAAIAGAAGSALSGALLWTAGGVVCVCGAVCYAECASRIPRSGGFFAFYRDAYGEPVAFVAGWAAVTVTYPASIAAIATILARYLGEIGGAALDSRWVAGGAILVAGAINVAGLRTGPSTQRVLTIAKVLALALLCLAALGGSSGPVASAPDRDVALGGGALLGALLVLLWTYDGWSDVTLVAGEIRDPRRDLGRAVMLGAATLAALYALVQVAAVTLLGPEGAATSTRVVADAVEAGLGPGAGRLVAALVVVSTFGSIQGVVLTTSRLGYAMAREGVFPARFAAVPRALGTPAPATAWVVAASLVYVATAGFGALLSLFSFAVWIFYAATAIAWFVLRRRGTGDAGAWRAPGGALAPCVILATAASITTALVLSDPKRAAAGLVLVGAGFPVWGLWRGLKRRSESSARSG